MKLQHSQVSPPSRCVTVMPEKPFPPHLKLQRLALAKAQISGLVPLSQFERLRAHGTVVPEAVDAAEPLVLELSFGFDSEGWLVIKGAVTGCLPMVCQRCLDRFDQPIALEISLARVSDEKQLARLPSEYEPLLHHEESILTVDLIEDDILLSLPLVPMHEPDLCSISYAEAESAPAKQEAVKPPVEEVLPKRENPFQVLAVLKDGMTTPEE